MSRNVCLVIAAFAVFALAACSRAPMSADRTGIQNSPLSAPTTGEMVSQLIAMDQQAIAHAEQARGNESLGTPALELVESIYMQHRRNLAQTRALGDAEGVDLVDTPAIKTQRIEHAKHLKAVAELETDAYRDAYFTTVIESHQQALELIDSYMQSTDNEAFRKHLDRTRGNFAHHLEMAKTLQDG